jgi:hypothetical protein
VAVGIEAPGHLAYRHTSLFAEDIEAWPWGAGHPASIPPDQAFRCDAGIVGSDRSQRR